MASTGLACVKCFKLLRRRQTKYCSRQCTDAHAAALYRLANPKAIYSSTTVGAIHELVVAVDLMKRGYSVFRALSPSCPGDLMAMMDSKALVVEVTTGSRAVNGALLHPKKTKYAYDLLAVVERSGKITYFPELAAVASQDNAPDTAPSTH